MHGVRTNVLVFLKMGRAVVLHPLLDILMMVAWDLILLWELSLCLSMWLEQLR